jgi:hypothetical protein
MRRFAVTLVIAGGLLASCEAVCGCTPPQQRAIVYGRVESATGVGIPTAVVLYRLAIDPVCVFDLDLPAGELDVGAGGKFRGEIYSFGELAEAHCLELRAFDPAVGKADTVSSFTLVDFANRDSTGVVLRLP